MVLTHIWLRIQSLSVFFFLLTWCDVLWHRLRFGLCLLAWNRQEISVFLPVRDSSSLSRSEVRGRRRVTKQTHPPQTAAAGVAYPHRNRVCHRKPPSVHVSVLPSLFSSTRTFLWASTWSCDPPHHVISLQNWEVRRFTQMFMSSVWAAVYFPCDSEEFHSF